jgi:hypothetical protein
VKESFCNIMFILIDFAGLVPTAACRMPLPISVIEYHALFSLMKLTSH